MDHILVTTGDVKEDYEIMGPLYFHISNKGFFTSRLSQLMEQYDQELIDLKSKKEDPDPWRLFYGNYAFDSDSRYEKAFYVAVREMQKLALKMGATAIIGFRQDIKLNIDNSQYFYLQIYGTAIRLKTPK